MICYVNIACEAVRIARDLYPQKAMFVGFSHMLKITFHDGEKICTLRSLVENNICIVKKESFSDQK